MHFSYQIFIVLGKAKVIFMGPGGLIRESSTNWALRGADWIQEDSMRAEVACPEWLWSPYPSGLSSFAWQSYV